MLIRIALILMLLLPQWAVFGAVAGRVGADRCVMPQITEAAPPRCGEACCCDPLTCRCLHEAPQPIRTEPGEFPVPAEIRPIVFTALPAAFAPPVTVRVRCAAVNSRRPFLPFSRCAQAVFCIWRT